jgi:hypothetical protein
MYNKIGVIENSTEGTDVNGDALGSFVNGIFVGEIEG